MNQLFLELLIRPTLPPGIFQTKWRRGIVGFHCFTQWICNSMWNCAKEDERLHLLAEHHQKRAKSHQRSQLELTYRPRPVDKKIQIFLPMKKKGGACPIGGFPIDFLFLENEYQNRKSRCDRQLSKLMKLMEEEFIGSSSASDILCKWFSERVVCSWIFFFSSAPLNHLLKWATS